MARYKLGYTTGVFDLFHVGHLKILRTAKSMCDHLIVGVSTDELVKGIKDKKPIISFEQRCDIVRSIRYVDSVIPQNDIDKIEAYKKLRFDILFVGDDHYYDEKWEEYDKDLEIIYIPYTEGLSTTLLVKIIHDS